MKLKKYEVYFILKPSLSEDDIRGFIEKFKQQLTENNGMFAEEPKFEKRRLEYPIKKEVSGYYLLVKYDSPSNFNNILKAEMKYDKDILRYMFLSCR